MRSPPTARSPGSGLPPPSHRWLARLRDGGLLALAVFAVVANYRAYRGFVFEDAFITYRYAENVALGQGFVFNPGERVLGASAPLYTLLLALLHRLGVELPTAGGLCTTVFLSALALAGAWLIRRQGFPNLAALYALVVLWGAGGVLHFWGMETTMLSFLVVAACAAASAERLRLAALLTGLACITRFDGAVLAVVLFGLLMLRERRLPWREALLTASVIVPWLAFSLAYFGSLLPNTLGAKAQDVATLEYMGGSVRLLALRFFVPLLRFAEPAHLPPLEVFFFLLFVVVAMIPVRVRALWHREPMLLVLVLYPIGLWLGYSLIGPPLEHPWYLTPGLFCLLAAACLAWGTVRPRLESGLVVSVASALLVLLSFVLLPIGVEREAASLLEEDGYRRRVGAYTLLASWLSSHGLEDLELFTLEPGYLAFLSKNPVVDGAGLVTEGVYFHGPEERRTGFGEIMREYEPQLLIVPDERLARGQAPREFTSVYRTSANSLVMRRDVFADRLDALTRDWLRDDYPYPGAVGLAHPLDFDFEEKSRFGWWGAPQFVGRPAALDLDGAPILDAYLTTARSVSTLETMTLESPPFRIDFDELRFWLAATGGAATAAELLVNGQVVLRLDGAALPSGEPREVRWPLYPWRGQVGILRFVDHAGEGGALAADRVRSVRHSSYRTLDDFDDGAYAAVWRRTFGESPTPFTSVAQRLGLGTIRGRYSALSVGSAGRREMRSLPFQITHDHLGFTVFDFGGRHRTRIELQLDGTTVRQWRGTFSRGLVGVIWTVAELRDRRAELIVLDEAADAEVGIGIDDIRLFDVPGD